MDRDQQYSEGTRAQAERKGKRGRAKYVFLGFVALVLLSPNFVGWLGLQKHAINYAFSDFRGEVNVGHVTLGWFQTINMRDVEVTDLTGQPILTVAKIQTQKPLYAFLISNDFGEIDIHEPTAFLHLRKDGSNVEDALTNFLSARQPSPNQIPAARSQVSLPKAVVRIHDGSSLLTTDYDSQTWQLDSLSASAELSGEEAPLAATVQFRAMSLQPDANGQLSVSESGTVLLSSAFDVGSEEFTFSTVNVKVESQKFPLSIAAPLAERYIGRSRISGTADSKLNASWNGKSNEIVADVQHLQANNARVYAPGLFNEDDFFLQQLTARGSMQVSRSRLKAESFAVETDFGKIDANGQFDPGQIANLAGANRLPDANLKIEGYLDLAMLMQRLPTTFQLHDDITIESGTVRFSAGQSNESNARRLVLNLDTANIRARRGNQPIVWQQPLRLVGTVRESGGQLAVENVECVSDFLNVSGSATFQEGMFQAKGDLKELSKRISQFADLGQFEFGGKLDGQFGWKVVAGQELEVNGLAVLPVQLGGEFTVTRPEIQLPDLPRWSPQTVVLRASGSGKLARGVEKSQLSLSQAGAQLVIDNESSVISLARPVKDAFSNRQWVLNTQVNGQVEGWLQHLRNFFDPGDFQASGALIFAGVAVLDAGSLRIENGQYEVKQLAFDGYGAKVREDRVVGSVTAGYSISEASVDVAQASLQGSGISATVQDMTLLLADEMHLDGQVAWRADINRVAQWLSLSTQPESIQWYGAAEGTASFKSSPGGTDAGFQADLLDVVAAQQVSPKSPSSTMQLASNPQTAWVELWREKNLKLSGQLNISSDFDRFVFEQLSARSKSLDIDAKGTISDFSQTFSTSLEGSYRPDLQLVNALLAAYSQGMLQLEGNGTYPFRVQGPLFSRESSEAWVPYGLTVQAMTGWERGSLLGLPIGKSDVQIDLQQQVAVVQANRLPVSGGIANLTPQLDMRGGELMLILGESRVLESIHVTPEICSSCLQYVAPWIAGAANAKGTFSADLQGLRLPVSDPMGLSARGSLYIHELTVDAGPLAKELLGTLTQIRSLLKPDSRQRQVEQWLRVESQTIPVVIENKKVYHEGVKFSHDELVVRTSGSVGIEDQSLDLVAKIPIADEWIEGNRYLSGLRGQSLSIPVSGTVDRPYIDPNRVNQLSRELIQNATQAAIGNVINDKVNPKLNDFNQKITGEVDKLQNRFNEKIGGFLNDKLGVPEGQNNGAPATSTQPSAGGQIENRINEGLKKGLDKLFGGS